jgi:predicted transcriptional regulator
MFLSTKRGLKYSKRTLDALGLARKRYYKALKQLKDLGLIEKSKESGGIYSFTRFGETAYQRYIVEVIPYLKYIEEIKMADSLKQTRKYTEEDIVNFVEKLSGCRLDTQAAHILGVIVEVLWEYEQMVSTLLERIALCRRRILLATRLFDENIFNLLFHKAKQGIEVKILVDPSLIARYFELHNSNRDSHISDENAAERIDSVGNPWYPDNDLVNRRVGQVPFSMIIMDETDVGIELINRQNTENFHGGILIRDEKTSGIMKSFYDKIWDRSTQNSDMQKDGHQ